jgi:hypothetical protein
MLEFLEERAVPSATSFTSFTENTLTGHTVRLSGFVAGTDLAGTTISISGVASGQATADATGFFSLQTDASGLGLVVANIVNSGQIVDTAQALVTTMTPSLTLTVTYGAQRTVTLSGRVTDESPGGLTVNFTGAAAGSTVTNADGTFSLTLQASCLGPVTATTADCWGVVSAPASVAISSMAPQITKVTCSEGINNIWTFQGKVTDESAYGLTVTFSGLPSLQGRTVKVQADGSFTLIVQLQPGEEGTVQATVNDWWGLASNTAAWIVRQTPDVTSGFVLPPAQ